MARRSRSARSRRTSRFTPRRWLPFVALAAVAALAVTLVAQRDDAGPPESLATTAANRLPVAAAPGALSTAWYCSGGTAVGADGAAELSVLIVNEASTGATAEVSVVGDNDKTASTTVELPARGEIRVIASSMLEADWAAMTVEVLGGHASVVREIAGPLGFDLSPCSTQASAQWYVPSGSTERGADGALALYNPFPGPTSVDIRFATDDGSRVPRSLQGLSIPGRSVRVVPGSDLPARRPEIATQVVARTGRIVVDRVQLYDGQGDPVAGSGDDAVATPAPKGLVATAAIPSLAPRWLFPDATVQPDARSQIAIYNPGSRSAEIDLVISYQFADRATDIAPIGFTVRPGEARIYDLTDVADLVPGQPFSVDLRSLEGVPVAAEQLISGAALPLPTDVGEGVAPGEADPAPDPSIVPETDPSVPETDPSVPATAVVVPGAAVVPGSPVAASGWVLPRPGMLPGRGSSIVVMNPGRAAVSVRVDELAAGARRPIGSATVEIPAGDRRTIDLTALEGNPPLLVEASGPVVASQLVVQEDGEGIAASLLVPWPETVAAIPSPPS